MDISILSVNTTARKRDFIDVPWILHQADPNWVPPLRHTVKKMLDANHHPFYQHAEIALWIAYRHNRPIGRIAGILNHKHNQYHNEQVAFWGFFEAENCPELATALFSTVAEWAKQNEAQFLRGPVNLSLNYECGMQVSAFDTQPFLMMTQNPPYYPELVESQGYTKAMDMHAWLVNRDSYHLHPKIHGLNQKLLNDPNIVFRTINMRNYYNEIVQFIGIYNDAWEKNWGFVPMSEKEVHYMAKELKSIIIPELAYFITVQGEPAACALFLPDINQALKHVRNGRLLPVGLLKLLWFLKRTKRDMQGRIPLLGVKQKFRHLQLASLFYAQYGKICMDLNMGDIECSWILETNKPMNFGLKHINAKCYKTYRIYEKSLLGP